MGKLRAAALLCLALAPSAWLAWTWRAMPQLGFYHDDAIYLVTAKSLAEGNGYRIASLPGEPPQTKYPPLFPALLAAVWRATPAQFPANLPAFMLVAWLGLALFVSVMWRLLREAEFPEWECTALAAFAALSPAVVQFGLLAMSELWFSALLMASLMAASRGHAWAAGAIAGFAFLTRTAALPLLATTPLLYLLRRERGQAWRFAAAMLPAVAGWQWWAAANRATSAPATLFYTDYFGFYLRDVTPAGLPMLVYENLNMTVKAIGELFIFDPDTGIGALTVARVLTAAAVSGCVRLVRAGRMQHYAAFGVGYTAEFLVWNYPPTQRFFLPLLPLLAAGLWRELQALSAVIAGGFRKRGADRAVALAMCALLGFFAWQSLRFSTAAFTDFYPKLFAERAGLLSARLAALGQLAASAPPGERILSYQDPLDYLYSGRRGFSLRVPPGVLKRGNREEIAAFFRDLPAMMDEQGVRYALLTEGDYHMDCPELTIPVYRAALTGPREFEAVYTAGPTQVLRLRHQSSAHQK